MAVKVSPAVRDQFMGIAESITPVAGPGRTRPDLKALVENTRPLLAWVAEAADDADMEFRMAVLASPEIATNAADYRDAPGQLVDAAKAAYAFMTDE